MAVATCLADRRPTERPAALWTPRSRERNANVISHRNRLGVLVPACLIFAALSAAPVLAGQGASGRLTTSISLDGAMRLAAGSSGPTVSGDATFQVTRSYPYDKETIWVTNKCYDAQGAMVMRRDAVVLWGTTVSLLGTTGPMQTAGAKCTAYVTLKPWLDRPLGDALLEYGVAS
jgi:hypothetical protein